MNLTLTEQQYLALVSLARKGVTQDGKRDLEVFLREVDKANGITRHVLLVQWQELNRPLPPSAKFPAQWPPEFRATIEQTTRPISRQDVEHIVKGRSNSATSIMVTKDLAGLVGWQTLDHHFLT